VDPVHFAGYLRGSDKETNMQRRPWILLPLALACAPVLAQAQTWPTRPVTIIVPQQAGSYSDNMIRPVAAAMQDLLGQPVVIENKPGANGIIGVEAAARAKPDGHTLLLSASSVFVSNTGLYKKLSYDPVKDFRPVAGLSKISMMFVARPDFPGRSIDELLAQAKRAGKPLDVAVGSSTAQLAVSLLASSSGLPFNAVPYKGSPQVTTDLLGGVVPLAVVDMASGASFVKSGRMVGIATTDSTRNAFLPDVPTLAERFPGATLVSWTGLAAPAGTPDEVVRILHEAVRRSFERADVQQRLATASITPALMTPEVLDRTLREDIPRWGTLMRAAGIERE
jgi:tripartite-type tricarboxylate transporter receptor subunit TctC